MKMAATISSESSVSIYQCITRSLPEDFTCPICRRYITFQTKEDIENKNIFRSDYKDCITTKLPSEKHDFLYLFL
jgi:hypothetical protein